VISEHLDSNTTPIKGMSSDLDMDDGHGGLLNLRHLQGQLSFL
jgi:hypothetical protein